MSRASFDVSSASRWTWLLSPFRKVSGVSVSSGLVPKGHSTRTDCRLWHHSSTDRHPAHSPLPLCTIHISSSVCRSDVSSGKSAGSRDRGWLSSSVRQRVAAIKRGDPSPRNVGGVELRLTPELVDEIREFIEEERGRISLKCLVLAAERPPVVCACVRW